MLPWLFKVLLTTAIPICPLFPVPVVVIVPVFKAVAPLSTYIPIFLDVPLNSIVPAFSAIEPFPVAYIPILPGVVTFIIPEFLTYPSPSSYPAAIPIPIFPTVDRDTVIVPKFSATCGVVMAFLE